MRRFYLGTHMVSWLGRTDVPLFISHHRLQRQQTWPRARGRWALDSGGFTELDDNGRWLTSHDEYATAIGTYHDRIGRLDWAAPQDWMCEPRIREKTGRSIEWHQRATIDSVQALNEQVYGVEIIPVLQGWTLPDYLTHIDMYEAAGIDLTQVRTVGLGSVCRRQGTREIAEIVGALHDRHLRLHGFGIKTSGLTLYGGWLTSADSLSWSFNARKHPPLPGHTHEHCNNCIDWALAWRRDVALGRPAGAPETRQRTTWEAA